MQLIHQLVKGNCECGKPCKARGYCDRCLERKRRSGELKPLYHNMPTELTAYQNEILDGLMLGDGCLFKYRETHKPYLAITRVTSDRDYLLEHAEIFKDFIIQPVTDKIVYDKRTNKNYFSSRLVSRHAKAFESTYNKWYPSGQKQLPDNINLTPLVLATWFCDDGWIGKSCGKRIKIKLSTHGFSKESVYKMAQRLTNLFKATFTIGCDNGKYFILSADKGAKAFAEYIAPVMPLSMKRKFKWITT